MIRNKNSSDLDVGRRPELKSDEFCDANVTVVQIIAHLCLKPLKQVVQLLAARPRRDALVEETTDVVQSVV